MSQKTKSKSGAFADYLTLTRVLLTPALVTIIIWGWPDTTVSVFATLLFAVAAFTDLADDLIGGSAKSKARRFGWFDDIADIILVIGTLGALSYTTWQADMLDPFFITPVILIIGRELMIGLLRGYELSRNGWPETRLGTLKNALYMLSVCLLVAAPWLTQFYNNAIATDANIMDIYAGSSVSVWTLGQICLWIAAILSVYTGFKLLSQKKGAANDG